MRRIVLTVLALAVLLPSLAIARTSYLCEIDRRVRETCCCPKAHAKDLTPETSMSGACCRELVNQPAVAPPVDELRSARAELPAIAVTVVSAPIVPVRGVHVSVVMRAQPPPDPEPLFARHCSFLL